MQHLLGLPWPEAERMLERAKDSYTLMQTGAPQRPPHGEDWRVVRVTENPLTITICAFSSTVALDANEVKED